MWCLGSERKKNHAKHWHWLTGYASIILFFQLIKTGQNAFKFKSFRVSWSTKKWVIFIWQPETLKALIIWTRIVLVYIGPRLLHLTMVTRVRMRRDFLNRLIEKYFEQLIDSVRVLRPHCRNFKANNFKHYCAAACARICQAHMQCTAAIDESVDQIWRNTQ